MSTEANINLMEDASFFIDYFEGTTIASVIENDVESNDLEALYGHIKEARDIMFQQEYNTEVTDVY